MKTFAIIKYVFILVGIGMLAGAFLLFNKTRSFLDEAVTTEGTVVALKESRSSDSTTYAPVVMFISEQDHAIEFRSSVSSNPPSYAIGDKVRVFYRPANPHDARIDGIFSLWGLPVILGGMGAVFLLAGGAMFLIPMLRERRNEQLRQHGTPIETEFQSVEINESLSVNGRHPYRILTQWKNPSTSEIHLFRSNNLWFDPTRYISTSRITVFIERNNPRKYFVDISFLPKLAE